MQHFLMKNIRCISRKLTSSALVKQSTLRMLASCISSPKHFHGTSVFHKLCGRSNQSCLADNNAVIHLTAFTWIRYFPALGVNSHTCFTSEVIYIRSWQKIYAIRAIFVFVRRTKAQVCSCFTSNILNEIFTIMMFYGIASIWCTSIN